MKADGSSLAFDLPTQTGRDSDGLRRQKVKLEGQVLPLLR